MQKFITLCASVVMLAALVPAVASAQTAGNGLLSVYVQVVNASNASTPAHSAGDFSVIVAGQNVSPSSFFGSINGTQVSVGPGSYSVAVSSTGNTFGYTPSYSQGCQSTLAAGQTALCVITMSPQYNNYPYPVPYPYPYTQPSLSCSPAHQTAGLGQSVSFSATGGVGGTYNWTVPGRNFPNVGPVLTTTFDSTGSQIVNVTNAAQSATCEITITNYPSFPTSGVYPTYPSTPTIYPTYPTYPTYPAALPNTGVEPLSALQMALALALLAGIALVASPYVRKAFAIVSR